MSTVSFDEWRRERRGGGGLGETRQENIEFFQFNFRRIRGFCDAGEYLIAIVKAQQVKIAALDALAAAADIKREKNLGEVKEERNNK